MILGIALGHAVALAARQLQLLLLAFSSDFDVFEPLEIDMAA